MAAKKINKPSAAKTVENSPIIQMLEEKLEIIDKEHEKEQSAYFQKSFLLSSHLIEEARKIDKKNSISQINSNYSSS